MTSGGKTVLKVNASATTFCRLYCLGDLLVSFSPRRLFAVFFLVANQIKDHGDFFLLSFCLYNVFMDEGLRYILRKGGKISGYFSFTSM